MITRADIEDAKAIVGSVMGPTPQYAWPLLSRRAGLELVVKHENHTPTGAFKVRGGLVYLQRLLRSGKRPAGLISATRGNHGQSIAYAAKRNGIPATIVVPRGNSPEKNAAMRAFGAELVEHGPDFDAAKAEAARLAEARGLSFVPAYHPSLVAGVATYALELFGAFPGLAKVYVPIGLGSGISGVIAIRDLLQLKTRVIGVVSEKAAGYKLSFEAGHVIATNSAATFADGMAVREPHPDALTYIRRGAEKIITLSEDEIADAVRLYFEAIHNIAEGAGAAPLAAAIKDNDGSGPVGVILSGGNIDRPAFCRILAGETPAA
ncbi:MAG: threonine dehydratase [Hyphomicrobiaceae bacterium]|nr:MAG: threonine dehydratase [Hyphomicrobiaceae bacterium]